MAIHLARQAPPLARPAPPGHTTAPRVRTSLMSGIGRRGAMRLDDDDDDDDHDHDDGDMMIIS